MPAANTHLDAADGQLPKRRQLSLGCCEVKRLVELSSQQEELDSKLRITCRHACDGRCSDG